MFDTIPTRILHAAGTLIRDQARTPVSPCAVAHGELTLCAAAAVAAVGLEQKRGPSARRAFEEAVQEASGMDVVRRAFDELGYGASVADAMHRENDAAPDHLRSEIIARWLLA